MDKVCMLQIGVKHNNTNLIIEVFPFDTPLQIAYRFCTQHSLEFNFISPLSKTIISFIQMQLEQGNLDQLTQNILRTHFDKFINNPTIRESLKTLDQQIRIQNQMIVIENKESQNFEFSFECEKKVDLFSPEFTFKTKLQEFLNPQPKLFQSPDNKPSKAESYIKKSSITQIENLIKYDQMSKKLLDRVRRISPNRETSSLIKKKLSHHNIGQVPSPKQTLPKRTTTRVNSTSRNPSPSSSRIKISVPRQKDSSNKNEQSIISSTNSQGTLIKQSKPDRVQSFRDLIIKLQVISTPQKQQSIDIYMKQINVTQGKIEQKLNELFTILDTNKDGYIDHNINLQVLKQFVIDLFEPVWFQILVKKQKVSKGQFFLMFNNRIKEIQNEDLKKFIFNGLRK
ncbi:hypothetical protein pb186bvf_005443 [Paramecium bursaria]